MKHARANGNLSAESILHGFAAKQTALVFAARDFGDDCLRYLTDPKHEETRNKRLQHGPSRRDDTFPEDTDSEE